jgi:hypothetical protein
MQITANMVLRFVLEIAGLVAAGYWGFAVFEAWPARIVWGIGLPVVMAVGWGFFRIPNDGGAPVVQVPPLVRIAIEAAFFAVAIVLLHAAGRQWWSNALLAVVVVNYAVDYQRTLPMLANRQPPPRM